MSALYARAGASVNLPSKDPGSKKNYTVDLSGYLGSDTLADASPVTITPSTGMTVSGLSNTTTSFSFFIDAGATVGNHTIIATWDTTDGIVDEAIAIKIEVVEAENTA